MAHILYVDDDPSAGLLLENTLERAGHTSAGARDVPEALQYLGVRPVDLIIADYRTPGTGGLELLDVLRRDGHETPLIMLTAPASAEQAVESLRSGAFECVAKPIRPERLEHAVGQALAHERLRRENEALRREVLQLRHERQVIGDSVAMRRVMQTIAMAAPTRATVLLQGESGTGKGLFARAIHDQSDRRDRPFVKLHCAAMPEGLVESSLFGQEKGGFTGAAQRVEGAFERANGGTLLLDEIGELRLDLQAKLLRVLQEQEFERVGGTSPVRVDVRIVATTSRNLAAEASAGNFRPDLYYRLSVIPVTIPPLRQRIEDVPLLAYRFAARTAAELGRRFEGITQEAIDMLQGAPWPGNVRELQHAVERAVILSADEMLHPRHFERARAGLPPDGPGPATSSSAPASSAAGAAPDAVVALTSLNVDEAERELIRRALATAGGNRTKAATLLGMSVRTLRNKLNGPGRAAEPAIVGD